MSRRMQQDIKHDKTQILQQKKDTVIKKKKSFFPKKKIKIILLKLKYALQLRFW